VDTRGADRLLDAAGRRLGLIANKTGATRLGFSAILKYFELEGRFPQYAGEVPAQAVAYLAEQVKVDAAAFAKYSWTGRTIEYHRAQVRKAFGFRECSEDDQARLAAWRAEEVCPLEQRRERLREAVVARCRAERLEPPAPGQVGRLVGSAVTTFEQRFCATITERLDAHAEAGLERLVDGADTDTGSTPATRVRRRPPVVPPGSPGAGTGSCGS
jgi:hypothetical protein